MTDPVFRSADAEPVVLSADPDKPVQPMGSIGDPTEQHDDVDAIQCSHLTNSSDGGALGGDAVSGSEPSTASPIGRDESPNPERLLNAHRLLKEAVSALQRRGRTTTSAGVKSEMKSIDSTFDESSLRFTGFRAFLEDAQTRGVATLAKAPTGPDVVVSIPGVDSAPSAQPKDGADSKVRPEIWRAFVAWDNGLRRVYDRQTSAIRLVERGPDGEDVADLDEEIEKDPDRFIEIKPIPRSDQLQWMRDFTERLDPGPVKSALSNALTTDRPLADFARVVRNEPGIAERWHLRLTRQVKNVIAVWRAEHGVTLEVDDVSPVGSSRPKQPKRPRPFEAARLHGGSLDDMRDAMLAVIAQLPTEELMQIKVPVVYLFKR